MRDELAGKKVVLVATGGNVSPEQLLDILGRRQAAKAMVAS
jgi:threonine dehydratase